MMKTPAFRAIQTRPPYSPFSQCVRHKLNSDAYFECLLRHLAVAGNNPIGACKMGDVNDTTTVVDPKLRCAQNYKVLSSINITYNSILKHNNSYVKIYYAVSHMYLF